METTVKVKQDADSKQASGVQTIKSIVNHVLSIYSSEKAKKLQVDRSSPEFKKEMRSLAMKLYTCLNTNSHLININVPRTAISAALLRIIPILENNLAASDKIYLITNRQGSIEIVLHWTAFIAIFKNPAFYDDSKEMLDDYVIQEEYSNGNLVSVKVLIYKKKNRDFAYPYVLSVSDVDNNSPAWQRHKKIMIVKTAIRQALTVYFPEVIARIPINLDNATLDPELFENYDSELSPKLAKSKMSTVPPAQVSTIQRPNTIQQSPSPIDNTIANLSMLYQNISATYIKHTNSTDDDASNFAMFLIERVKKSLNLQKKVREMNQNEQKLLFDKLNDIVSDNNTFVLYIEEFKNSKS